MKEKKAQIFQVKSSSKEGLFYTVRIMPDGEIRCSCPGFVFNGKCKHVLNLPEVNGSDAEALGNPNSSKSEPKSDNQQVDY